MTHKMPTTAEQAAGRRAYIESCTMENALAGYNVPYVNTALLEKIKVADEAGRNVVRREIERLRNEIRQECLPLLEELAFLEEALGESDVM